jgi:alanyl-tRNA synthetase
MGGKGGGGRPDMAQAGGVDIAQAEAAIKAAEAAIGG